MLIFFYQQDEHDDRMKTMNVTAKHGQAAVHLGGSELINGRWTPACRIQHHNTGGREVTPLRPTDKAVTCKRCLKVVDAQAKVIAIETRREMAKASFRKIGIVHSPKIKRTEQSGMDSLRSMLKLY